MNGNSKKAVAILLSLGLMLNGSITQAEDIDIYVGGTEDSTRPNILIVLDNTSNWSRQSQKWPGGKTQGESEVAAIKAALSGIAAGRANVGLMEFVTEGTANDDGGFIRHAVKEWDGSTNSAEFNTDLTTIAAGINTPLEKRNSGTAYSNLVYDVYNYFADAAVFNSGKGTPSTRDAKGYETVPTKFETPLTEDSICGNAYVIYITNPNQSGPTTDSVQNSTTLAALINGVKGSKAKLAGDASGTPIPLPNFTTSTTTETTVLGTTTACKRKNDTAPTEAQVLATLGLSSSTCTDPYSRCDLSPTSCTGANVTFTLKGVSETFNVTPNNNFDNVKGAAWNFDDWAQFLYLHGVPYGDSDSKTRGKVVTYTIDVFNAQQSSDHTALMMSAARVGGGRYFAARNEEAIKNALQSILAEILSVNSTFASAALPVTATNRSQNENQVYIPMFRPDPQARPLWFGNLKRYQIGMDGGYLALADKNGNPAANQQTGYIADCAESYWSSTGDFKDDAGVAINNYWENRGISPNPKSECPQATYPFSDAPDGPFVEKGGVSQVLRKGNTGDDQLVNRTIYTQIGDGALTALTQANSGLSATAFNFIRGQETTAANKKITNANEARMTIHGDVVHSRPLPINYGGISGITVFYGSNDGTFRAVDAETGQERWALVAEEHLTKLSRLYDNTPNIYFPSQPAEVAVKNKPKDYFFDGSTSYLVYYDKDNVVSKASIYPTMRRGGRMLYALNVDNPVSPSFKWKIGCPNLDNDTGCSSGFDEIGQTWSMPAVGLVKGYGDGNSPVMIVGGGYDNCEDADSTTTACTDTAKGQVVYVLDTETGGILKSFATEGSVPADIAVVDVNLDGRLDFAYAVDTRGNLYRINFVDPVTGEARAEGAWTMTKVAFTTGGSRKFLHAPALFPDGGGNVYVAVGSGNRERPLETNYPYASPVEDRFYVVLDRPASGWSAFSLDDPDLMNVYGTSGGMSSATCDTDPIDAGSDKRGWYLDFENRGEQTVTTALIHLGEVVFSTSQAGGNDLDDNMCTPPTGTARSYQLNLFTGSGAWSQDGSCGGLAYVTMAGGGLPPSPVMATVKVGDKLQTVIIGAGKGGIGNVEDAKPVVKAKVKRKYWGSMID